jgi:hypothetical protein
MRSPDAIGPIGVMRSSTAARKNSAVFEGRFDEEYQAQP